MSALSDLQTAVTNLVTASNAEIAAITTELQSKGDDVTAADVEAAVTQINQVTTNLQTETASLAPPPPPASS